MEAPAAAVAPAPAQQARKTFVRAVECWVPGHDRTTLEFGDGLYAHAPRLGASSRAMVFGRGEGLPGIAWEAGHPVVMKDLQQPTFLRARAAAAEGLSCGIAVPVFAGDFLTAVLVIFCGDDEHHAGAIEVWHNDPASSKDMVLADGYYGATGDTFETISRSISFRRGHGLPGLVWASGLPLFIEDLGRGQRFLRADSAVRAGINRGFALPCSSPHGDTWVLALLSALATPIVRRVEVWTPDPAHERLHCQGGFCESCGALPPAQPELGVGRGQGVVGLAFLTGVPALSDRALDDSGPFGAAAAAAQANSLVALPVLHDGRLRAVVAWYF